MDLSGQLIPIKSVHEAIALSVPYDMYHVVQGFNHFFQTLPSEEYVNWTTPLHEQPRYMTLEQVFKCLASINLTQMDYESIQGRLIGNLACHRIGSYEYIEEVAKKNSKAFVNGN